MLRLFAFFPRHWWRPRAWRTWSSYVHWRLETYGVFYPAGKTNWTAVQSLLKQMPSYLRWLKDFERIKKG